jgi:hypothetical protein
MWREPQANHIRRKTAGMMPLREHRPPAVLRRDTTSKRDRPDIWQFWTTQHALADAEGRTGFQPIQIVAGLSGDSIPGEGITRRFNRSRPMKVVIITETVSGAWECQVADIRICRARQFCDEK